MREQEQAKRQHPEAEHRQETDETGGHQQGGERRAHPERTRLAQPAQEVGEASGKAVLDAPERAMDATLVLVLPHADPPRCAAVRGAILGQLLLPHNRGKSGPAARSLVARERCIRFHRR